MAMALPSTTAPCHDSSHGRSTEREQPGEQEVARHRADDGQEHLRQAQPEHQAAHAAQLGQVELEPDDEHQEDDAELGQVADAARVLRQRQRIGADQHAHGQVAEHGRQLQLAAHHHAGDRSDQVQQDQIEGGCHQAARQRVVPTMTQAMCLMLIHAFCLDRAIRLSRPPRTRRRPLHRCSPSTRHVR